MLINVLSNVWLYPMYTINNYNGETSNNELNLKKLQEQYGINKIINLDKELEFWWKVTEQYLPEIQEQMDKRNYSKLIKKFNYYIQLISRAIIDCEQNILFVSVNSLECLLAFHLYIYVKYCNLPYGIIQIIKQKYPLEIELSNKIKMIFAD